MNASASGTIDVTLPRFPNLGDFVSVRGVSGNPWRIIPNFSSGQSARSAFGPQYVVTTNLNGNMAPGQNWTARMPPRQWQWVASDAYGSILVAAAAPGNLYVSLDGGVTWDAGDSPTANWSSVAIERTPSQTGDHQFHIVAVAQGGGMYRYGAGIWVQTTAPGDNQDWVSVALDPGGSIIAAVFNGTISSQSGEATAEGSTTPLVRQWRALARALSVHSVMAAVSEEGEVWLSTDLGRTFTQRNVIINGSPVLRQWYRVAISSDGNTIAVAGRTNSGLYISRDRGLTWSQSGAPVGDYTAIDMSGDGQVIGATLANGAATTGSVQLSTDGGVTFSALTLPGTETHWRAFAMSSDGNQFTVAAGTPGTATGQLYTSVGNRTSLYPSGSITGGQNDYIELEYMGVFNTFPWRVRASSGGPFTIQ